LSPEWLAGPGYRLCFDPVHAFPLAFCFP
jgi:hypothetical protein